jgi:DNA polymerase-3 subunit delta
MPADPVPRVVLLAGPEATLRQASLDELRERALEGGPRDFNEDVFDVAVGGTDAVALAATLRTLPVLAPRRLVRVRGLESKRAAKFIEGPLLAYLEDPAETTCLILEAESVDRRLRWVKRVGQVGEVRSCTAPSKPQELRAWIEQRVRAAGKRAGSGMASALFERTGPELDRIASEIDKLVLYVGDRDEISPDDVAELASDLRDFAIYELTDAIGNRRLPEALRLLSRLLAQGEAPIMVLGGLGNHYRRLLRASECVPLEADEVRKRLSLHPYAARKLVDQVRRFDGRRLRRCLDAVRRTDEALKGGVALSPELAIEQLVLAVCA